MVVEPLPLPPALVLLPAAAGPGLTARVPPAPLLLSAVLGSALLGSALLRCALPVSGSQRDLQLVQLIPLGIGALPLWNRLQRLQAGTGGNRLWIIHGRIIASFDRDALITYRDEGRVR